MKTAEEKKEAKKLADKKFYPKRKEYKKDKNSSYYKSAKKGLKKWYKKNSEKVINKSLSYYYEHVKKPKEKLSLIDKYNKLYNDVMKINK